jgi:hypothetical protein
LGLKIKVKAKNKAKDKIVHKKLFRLLVLPEIPNYSILYSGNGLNW